MGWFDIFGKAKEIGSGVKDITDGIGQNTSLIISTIKDKVPPAMRGEITKLELQLQADSLKFQKEAELKIQELMQSGQKQVYDFALQYEGNASQVPKWILVLRSVIRPIITIIMFLSLMFFMGYDIKQAWSGEMDTLIMASLPQAYYVILGIVLGFWFGGKAGENIVDRLRK